MPNVNIQTTQPVLTFDAGNDLVAFLTKSVGETVLYNNDLLFFNEYETVTDAAAAVKASGLNVQSGRWPGLEQAINQLP